MVPTTTVTHFSSDSLILYDTVSVPVSCIVGLAPPPCHIIRLVTSGSGFARMDLEVCKYNNKKYLNVFCNAAFLKETAAYLAPHHLKSKAAGKRVVMVPLILFSDDTSGNRSKKWHKFESWFVSLAGLPRHLNARLENIHFVSCSDSVSPLDLSGPIAQELATLETEGALVFDAYFQEVVLVIAPLIIIVCDNPRASDLVNHLGSKALKYCRICMASYYHCIPLTATIV